MGGETQVTATLWRSGSRCMDGWGKSGDEERMESQRASGGQLEIGRSGGGGLKENTWPGRSSPGLETGTESSMEGWG